MDVKKFLYTNIHKSEGIVATKGALDKRENKTVATEVITTLLLFILTLNNFVLDCKNYLRIKICAMRTISAPSYANIFMAEFENKYIYPLISNMSMLYCHTLITSLL